MAPDKYSGWIRGFFSADAELCPAEHVRVEDLGPPSLSPNFQGFSPSLQHHNPADHRMIR